MTVTTFLQPTGNANNTIAEVEAATRALRGVQYPADFLSYAGGAYTAGFTCNMGTSGAVNSLWSNGIFASFRWTSKATIARLRSVTLSMVDTDTTANARTFMLYRVENFVAQHYSVSTPTFSVAPPTLLIPKMRGLHVLPSGVGFPGIGTGAQVIAIGDIVYYTNNTTADTILGLVGGSGTRDTQPVASITTSTTVTNPNKGLAPIRLWDVTAGDSPISFAAQQGFHLCATFSGSLSAIGLTTVVTSVQISFEEVPVSIQNEEYT